MRELQALQKQAEAGEAQAAAAAAGEAEAERCAREAAEGQLREARADLARKRGLVQELRAKARGLERGGGGRGADEERVAWVEA